MKKYSFLNYKKSLSIVLSLIYILQLLSFGISHYFFKTICWWWMGVFNWILGNKHFIDFPCKFLSYWYTEISSELLFFFDIPHDVRLLLLRTLLSHLLVGNSAIHLNYSDNVPVKIYWDAQIQLLWKRKIFKWRIHNKNFNIHTTDNLFKCLV